MTHVHKWQRIYEESLIGGTFPIGYQCKECGAFVNQSDMTPEGIGGVTTGETVLIGPHGCKSKTSGGKDYSKQIIYPDGRLEIIP